MTPIDKNNKINVEGLKSLLLRRRITPLRFKLPLTYGQTVDALTAAYMAEVELRRQPYRQSAELTAYIEAAAHWLADGKKFGLLLCGLPGNGKTTLMKAVTSLINFLDMKDDHGDTIGVSTYDAREITRLNRDNYDTFKRVCNFPVLAIDDLGIEPTEVLDYGNVLSPVIDLLTVRYNNMLPTLVTTNLTGKDIRVKYKDRIADRFNEMMQVIIFSNSSYRGQKQ